jgi:capsular polysaccharide biosynthesis protein
VTPLNDEGFVSIPHSGIQNAQRFPRGGVVKSVVFPQAEQQYPPIGLLPDATELEQANAAQYRQYGGTVGEVGFYFLRDISVRGRGFLVKEGNRIYRKDLIPDYVEAEIVRGLRTEFEEKEGREKKHFQGTSVLLTSEAYPIYGHWLIDTLPKAWLYVCCLGVELEDVRYLFCHDTPEYGLSMLAETFDIPRERMEFYDFDRVEPCLERALVPSLLHHSHVFHPAMRNAVHYMLEKAECTPLHRIGAPASRYLYVSRSRFRHRTISSRRSIANEQELVDTALAAGFEVVYPEELTWHEQIRLFSSARVVVGESGSGLHNTLFSAPGTVVLCLCPSTQVQGTIAAVMDQRLFFLSPASQVQVDGGWEYRIDPTRFEQALEVCRQLPV